ncbi:hypothetical protein ACFL1Y_01870 [Patescibacteria group bacterium]
MNNSVALFFIHTTIATFLLGIKFVIRKDSAFKYFGIGLILNAVAFAFWTVVVFLQPENIKPLVTAGVIFFLFSLFAYFVSSIQKMDKSIRNYIMWSGLIGIIILFILRIFVYPSNPGFSSEGLFFFNPHPIIQALEIFGLAMIALPAVSNLASKFSNPGHSALMHYGFIVQVMGAIILIASTNNTLLYVAGWVIGIGYLILWTVLLFSKKAWEGIK